jgi:cytochrome c2
LRNLLYSYNSNQMKTLTSKTFAVISVMVLSFVAVITITSCKASQQISSKTGAQLWAENCQRCHNTPSPSTFSPDQWETVGLHMQSRSLITDDERNKIVEFLKQ